uniref:HTH CENPB-type domain-containing protein n=1 Tax=Eptatretus burgeri TaxID=7764 RepID=A0A8C4WY32_EPTBU
MAHGNRRVHYSTGFKLNVIALAEVTGNRAAAREFKVGETCVRRWRKLKEDLVQCGGKRFCFTGPRNGRFPEVGGELAQAIHHRRQESLPVNASWVLLKAREIAKQHSVYENGLKVSPSWVDKFRKTNGVYLRPKTCISQNKGVPCLGEGFENEQDRSENETNIKGTSEQRERERVGGNTETVNDLKKLWKSPRDTFMKYKRDSQTKSGQARKSPIHWKYWNMMRFLKPYTSNERVKSFSVAGVQILPPTSEKKSHPTSGGRRQTQLSTRNHWLRRSSSTLSFSGNSCLYNKRGVCLCVCVSPFFSEIAQRIFIRLFEVHQ